MRIIDRYIVREVVLPFLLFLGIFTFILVVPFLIQYAEAFIAKGVPVMTVARVMATLLPQAFALAIPAALLIGLLWGFGRLSADREFVAIQACGIGLARLLRPVGVLCIGGWAATSYVMLVALPDANQTFREITFAIVASRAEGEIKPRTFFDSFPNLVIYARDVPSDGGWDDVFIADQRPGQTPAVYLARHGRVVLDRGSRTVQLVLEEGTRHSTDSGAKYEIAQFARAVVSVDPESVFPRRGPQKEENEMTVAELRARAVEVERVGQSSHNQVMAIHRKFAFPVACLVFGLIGLALGATNRRDGKLGSFVFGLGVIFVYYVPLYLGPAMAKGQLLAPWLAVWLPNILLGLIGSLMLMWRARAADQPLTGRMLALFDRVRRTRPAVAHVAPAPSRTGAGWSRILDRYVGALYARVFLVAAAGLAGLFYVSTFLDLSDKVFKAQASWTMLGAYLWYISPQYLYYVLPMAVLLAALVTIGLLTKNSELIVMKACGVSLYRVSVPMVAGAVLAGACLFMLDRSILGPSNRKAEAIRHVMRGGSPETFDVLSRQWMTSPSGEIYHFTVFDAATQELHGLDVFAFSRADRMSRRTHAERVAFASDGRWLAERGWVREFDDDGSTSGYATLEQAPLELAPVSYFATSRPDPQFMSYSQLRDYVSDLRASGFDVSELRVALERKLSFPFVTIIMTLIAVPFAVTTGRGGAMFGIAAGIGLAIAYWVAISVFAALGAGGVVEPLLAAWAPNAIFGSAAGYLLLTVRT